MGQKFLISDFDVGFENDKEPFLLPEKAFPLLEDAFVWRGKVRKRAGFTLLNSDQLASRLRINLGNTGASPFGGTVPGTVPIPSPGRQVFSIGTVILTSNQTGVGVQNLISTDPTYSGTLNNTTGVYSIVHPAIAATPVYYYPGLPVMGLRTRETTTVNFEQTVAFDTQFSYFHNGTGWNILGPTPPAANSGIWTGTNSDFFWTTNFQTSNNNGLFWATNNVANSVVAPNTLDGIQIYDGTNWYGQTPQIDAAANELRGCLMLIPFKDRMVALNTLEGAAAPGAAVRYQNRARCSQNGVAYTTGLPGAVANAWLQDTNGLGFYIDAPTSEAITSAQFVQNRLIVFFERSTYELLYTGNEILPFVWQKINTELGCEATFSEVPFDKGVIGVGNRGIHIANTGAVERIDEKIPDLVSQIENLNSGPQRVYGIRDYFNEIVMWTFSIAGNGKTFPTKVLLYNYRNNSFAVFNDNITCYGYFQLAAGITWATILQTWEEYNNPWNTALTQARFPFVIAGNQQGWTYILNNVSTNDYSLMVTDVTNATLTITAPDHNLINDQYIILNTMGGLTFDVDGTTYTNDYVYSITSSAQNTFVLEPASGETLTITGTYTGGGQIQVLNNFDIKTKNFALFQDQDKKTNLNGMHILTTKTDSGEYTLNLYQDFNFSTPILPLSSDNSAANIAILSSVRTYPEEDDDFSNSQDKIWHEVQRGLLADTFQLEFTLSDAQMRDLNIQPSDFELHGILFDVDPSGRLK